MSTHHPGVDLLLSYSAGSLGEGWSLAIATHLAYCPTCRSAVEDADDLGRTEDLDEGTTAFREKRDANFRGR